jgi:hypothetical protein
LLSCPGTSSPQDLGPKALSKSPQG